MDAQEEFNEQPLLNKPVKGLKERLKKMEESGEISFSDASTEPVGLVEKVLARYPGLSREKAEEMI